MYSTNCTNSLRALKKLTRFTYSTTHKVNFCSRNFAICAFYVEKMIPRKKSRYAEKCWRVYCMLTQNGIVALMTKWQIPVDALTRDSVDALTHWRMTALTHWQLRRIDSFDALTALTHWRIDAGQLCNGLRQIGMSDDQLYCTEYSTRTLYSTVQYAIGLS